jgi:hypothetical protein
MVTPESNQLSIWTLVISSAAVGAVVSSAITELGKWRERKSRREELALSKAFEMAQSITNTGVELIKVGKRAQIMPMNETIAAAYVTLKHILAHEKLDPAAQKEVDEEYRQHGIDRP